MDEPTVTCDKCHAAWDSSYWFCPEDGSLLVIGRAVGGEWVLEERLGNGAMGAVYRARHRLTGHLSAVKLLGPRVVDGAKDEATQRFLREGLARVRHENCVEIHDVGRIQHIRGKETALWWLRMDYVDGQTLESVIATGPLPIARVLRYAVQMSAGLQACHEVGVVHRDFKPTNVMVETSTDRIRIADYGIARVAGQPTLTAPNEEPGTPLYAAPEIFGGARADERSDLFALGVVMFELLTGKHPFDPDNTGSLPLLMARVLFQEPVRLTALAGADAAEIEPIVMRLLQKNPVDRFGSAREVHAALFNLTPVRVRVFNENLELDVEISVPRGTPLADVRRTAIARASLPAVSRRILENPRTEFGWAVKGTRLADGDTLAKACEIAKDAMSVDLHLRAHPDVMLGG